jgi:hypothetical protein
MGSYLPAVGHASRYLLAAGTQNICRTGGFTKIADFWSVINGCNECYEPPEHEAMVTKWS